MIPFSLLSVLQIIPLCIHVVGHDRVAVHYEVGGEAGDVGTVQVMEGDVLRLHSGVTDLEENVQVLWSVKSASLNTRVAQLYHGKIYSNYHERFSGRAQLDQQTGSLTISDIRIDESGLYDVFINMNRHISERKYKVDVYAPIIVPTPKTSSLISVHQLKGTSQTSNSTTHLQNRELCPHDENCMEYCGSTEVVVRLVLSGLVGIATVVFLLEHVWHMRCCSVHERNPSSDVPIGLK